MQRWYNNQIDWNCWLGKVNLAIPTKALFGAPTDIDQLKGRLDQGFTDMIFGLPQAPADKVLAHFDKIVTVVEQVR